MFASRYQTDHRNAHRCTIQNPRPVAADYHEDSTALKEPFVQGLCGSRRRVSLELQVDRRAGIFLPQFVPELSQTSSKPNPQIVGLDSRIW